MKKIIIIGIVLILLVVIVIGVQLTSVIIEEKTETIYESIGNCVNVPLDSDDFFIEQKTTQQANRIIDNKGGVTNRGQIEIIRIKLDNDDDLQICWKGNITRIVIVKNITSEDLIGRVFDLSII